MNADRDLIERALDGRLSDEAFEHLAARMKVEPQLARDLIEASAFEGLLRQAVAAEKSSASSRVICLKAKRRARIFSRFAFAAAAIAVFAVIVGLFGIQETADEFALEIVGRPTGRVSVFEREIESPAESGRRLHSGASIRTAGDSKVRLRWLEPQDSAKPNASPNETWLVLRPDSRLTILHANKGGRNLRLEAGELFCAAAKTKSERVLTIATSDAEARILGTTFGLAAHSEGTRLNVWEGTVRLTRTADQAEILVDGGNGVSVRGQMPLRLERLDGEAAGLDFAGRRTAGDGAWAVERTEQGTLIRQSKADVETAHLFFGEPCLRSGVLTGQYRVMRTGARQPAVGYALFYPDQAVVDARNCDDFVRRNFSSDAVGIWFNFNVLFQQRADGKFEVRELVWREDEPPPLSRKIMETSVVGDALGAVCGIGLNCSGAAVEYRNLRLAKADDASVYIEKPLRERVFAKWEKSSAGVDFNDIRSAGNGQWFVAQEAGETIVGQERDDVGPTLVLFGQPHRKRGVFTGQYKIPSSADEVVLFNKNAKGKKVKVFAKTFVCEGTPDEAWIAPCLHYPNPNGGWLFNNTPRLNIVLKDAWINFVVWFELDDADGLTYFCAAWEEGKEPPFEWERRWMTVGPNSSVKHRKICDVGVVSNRTPILWRRLRVVETSPFSLGPAR